MLTVEDMLGPVATRGLGVLALSRGRRSCHHGKAEGDSTSPAELITEIYRRQRNHAEQRPLVSILPQHAYELKSPYVTRIRGSGVQVRRQLPSRSVAHNSVMRGLRSDYILALMFINTRYLKRIYSFYSSRFRRERLKAKAPHLADIYRDRCAPSERRICCCICCCGGFQLFRVL